jgi:hypothetical protein
MNAMNIPGFTADASLCSPGNRYYVRGMDNRTEQNVYPANIYDCLANCKVDCGIACAGTSGQGKAGCIAECRGDNQECETNCRRFG